MKDNYIELEFEVTHNAGAHIGPVNADDIGLANLTTIVLFIEKILTLASGKILERFNYARVTCLMYKLSTSNKDKNGLSNGSRKVIKKVKKH